MEWIEVRVKTTPEAVELVTGLLMVQGIPNVRIIDDAEADRFLLDHAYSWDYKDESLNLEEGAEIIFYLQEDDVGCEILARIEEKLNEMVKDIPEIDFGNFVVRHGPVNDDDWLHEWKKTYKPFTIGRGVVVRPFWEEYKAKEGETVFTIDPGAVFGTGLHVTTQLCVMSLEDVMCNDKKEGAANRTVLDVGCGSGILSVIALLLGAGKATACDIDPGAARCARDNAKHNNIEETRYEVCTGELLDLEEKEYDIVVANIVADVIISIVPDVGRYLKADGLFISSGIIDERVEEVKAALGKRGFVIKSERSLDGWFSIVAGKM